MPMGHVREQYELSEILANLQKCFQQQCDEAWEMQEKNQKISQLEDEGLALRSQIEDLKIQLVMKNF